jgi:predicted ABC-type transport system involved in lysophospholipase L1 biosynthesis ATPase subunit
MTIARGAMRAVHLGERLDEGPVTWSGNTQGKALALRMLTRPGVPVRQVP